MNKSIKSLSLDNFFVCWTIFFTAFLVRLGYLHFIGIKYGSDSTYYTRAANFLSQSGFNFAYLSEQGYAFFYWLYPLFLTFFNQNYLLVILVQIFLHSVASILVFYMSARLFDRTTGILAGFGYAFLWEVFQWDMYVLTDSFFLFTIVFCAFLALFALEKNSLLNWLIFILGVSTTIFLRPTVFPFLAAAAVFISWNFPRKYKLTGFIFVIIILGWAAYNIFFQTGGPQFGLSPYFHYFASLFEKGIIVRDRPSLALNLFWTPGFNLQNVINFIGLFLARIVVFWSPLAKEFSLSHNIFNLLIFLPLVLFGFFGIFRSLKNVENDNKYRFISFLLSVIVFFWIFQSLTEIDYDWRYRLPVLPFVLIFASYGFELFLKSAKLKFANKHL